MKFKVIIILSILFFNRAFSQNLILETEDITPAGIEKIGGISTLNNGVYLLLQSNLIFEGKAIEASEAINIAQKYPVWDVYQYNIDSRQIESRAEQWPTKNAAAKGFTLANSAHVIYVDSKNRFTSNNPELKNALTELYQSKIVFADPYLCNNKLWFSANLPEGFGGMDIWFIEKNGSHWGKAINAGATINSVANEISPAVLNDSMLVFSTNNSNSNYDMFFYDLQKKQMLHQHETPNSNEYFTAFAPDSSLYYVSETEQGFKLYKSTLTDARQPEVKLIEAPVVEKIETATETKSLANIAPVEQITNEELNIQMTNYFGVARYELTPFMKDSLTRLAQTLKQNPDQYILICGHASPDGPENLNMMLSYYRANEAYNWLIEKGIDKTRIYRVYGGEYLFVGSQKARNFSIFTFQYPDLPEQIALYPISKSDKPDQILLNFGTDTDDQSYHRYQLNKFLPVDNEQLLLVPISLLYFAKAGENISEIARKYNIPPFKLKQINNIQTDILNSDKVLFV
ncbi:MAG: OmpA family protein, partial [Prolixibacteraceae bacterium]|nr:OmpA family protein [Prolixibacteraceae bacterium]